VFCAVVSGTTAAHVVADTADVLAFLDRAPVFVGHILVVPKAHHETLIDVPEQLLGSVMAVARGAARAVEGPFGAHGSFVAMNNRISQSVPHLHVHVVPRHRKDGLRGFFWPRTRYDSEEHAAEVAANLRAAISATGTIAAPDDQDRSP